MRPARFFVLAVLILIFAFSTLLYAGVPQMINYQGKITTPAGALIDTTVQMIFTIYDDSTSGNVLWADTLGSVAVEKGIFSVLLGSVNPIPDSVFPGDVRYLGVKVGADPEMIPRKQIVSVAYAYKSEYADTAEYARMVGTDGDWTVSGNDLYRLDGNVGIGTVSPLTSLYVYRDTNAFVGISIENPNTESNSCEGIYFWNEDIGVAGIRLFDEGHASYAARMNIFNNRPAGSIHFGTAGQLTRMTIANDGNVGIGTTSPGADLDIVSANPNLRLSTTSGTPVITLDKASGGYWSYLEFREAGASKWQAGVSSSNDYYILNWPSSKYVFYANSAGNVGIGTTSPGSKLEIRDSGALQFAINNTSGRNWVMRSDNTGKFSLWDFSSLNDAFTVSSSGAPDAFTFEFKGDVGIGTPSPGSKLELSGDGSLQFAINNTSGRNWVMRSDNTGKFSLWDLSAGYDALIVTSSGVSDGFTFEFKGKVGIGTASPGTDLDIVSTNPNLRLSTTSGSPVITLDKASGYWSYLEFREGGASKWQAGVTSSNDYYILNWPASKYVFYANSAGNVGIGTTSPTGQLDVNGNDIRIRNSQTPASSSADGYEGESAWDKNYIYICVGGDGPGGATDSWKRAAISTW